MLIFSFGSFLITQHAVSEFMRHGRIEFSPDGIGDLRDVPASGGVALVGIDRHLQDLAFAVRIRAAF